MNSKRNLHWKSPEELERLGYSRDSMGRIRQGAALVCGISGTHHTRYLMGFADYCPLTSEVTIVYVSKDEAKRLGLKLAERSGVRIVADIFGRILKTFLV